MTLGKYLESENRLHEVRELAKCKELFADLHVTQPWIKDGFKVKLPSSRCPWSTRSCEIILSVYGTLNIDKLFASEWAIGTNEQGIKFPRFEKSKMPRDPVDMLVEKCKSLRSTRGEVRRAPFPAVDPAVDPAALRAVLTAAFPASFPAIRKCTGEP